MTVYIMGKLVTDYKVTLFNRVPTELEDATVKESKIAILFYCNFCLITHKEITSQTD